MSELTEFFTPLEAWDELTAVRGEYVRKHWAAYSGLHKELAATAVNGSFWKRRSKAKVHVPLAADIAAVSANMTHRRTTRSAERALSRNGWTGFSRRTSSNR